jgi:hypothetical protein
MLTIFFIWAVSAVLGLMLVIAGYRFATSRGYIGDGFIGMGLIALGAIPLVPVWYPLMKIYDWYEDQKEAKK